ncbi:uncharacterized protein LOC132270012 [Cornus florida]|uniref:uncharacterized protein LOC132270012 n=1 Tax=Cornus florida TaxID=4283 RepID=UPI002896FDAD|nr:uncharacterized protein LOC132270012 [Cornus florida]
MEKLTAYGFKIIMKAHQKLIYQMSPFSPLANILKENRLTGPNYIDWKRQLDIILKYEGLNYMLTTPRPSPPLPEDPPEEHEVFKKWNKADEMTRCYILASISNVLQSQHLQYLTSADIMLNLKEMFGQIGKSAR